MAWKPGDGKDKNWSDGACEIAEIVCKWHLERTYGSVEEGMKIVGLRHFNKWISRVEAAIESENPEELD